MLEVIMKYIIAGNSMANNEGTKKAVTDVGVVIIGIAIFMYILRNMS